VRVPFREQAFWLWLVHVGVEATMEEMLEMHNAFLRNSRKLMPAEIRHKIVLIPSFV
jgi:hypothetical protein